MNGTMRQHALACAALMAAVGVAQAQSVRHGRLEMVWGDAPPGGSAPRAPILSIADGRGGRERVDLAAARAVVDDLHALYGREVDLTLAPGPWPDGLVPVAIAAAPAALDAPASPQVAGSQPWVTLLCRFADTPGEPPRVPDYFSEMLSNDPGRLDHYWREVSYDKVDLAGSEVAGWFTLPYPRSHYVPEGAACFSDLRADLDSLWADCTAVADEKIDFSPFAGINTMYDDELDGCAWGGGHYAELDGVSKLWYSTWEPPWGYANEAPLAHEMGHGFGLPHANNSDGDGDPYDNPWDVMSDAWDNAVEDAAFGSQPKHIGIWSRDKLGWIDAQRKLRLAVDGLYPGIVLDHASRRGSEHVQMIVVTLPPSEPANHYYVIEARERNGLYEGALAGSAVIVHEVRANRDEPAWSVDATAPPADVSNNPGSMFTIGESWTAPDEAFTLEVTGQTPEGFIVDVQRGRFVDRIFQHGFE